MPNHIHIVAVPSSGITSITKAMIKARPGDTVIVENGKYKEKVFIKAGVVRLRPILMTAFSLVAGMLPLAIGLNEASSQRTSMGIAVIGGTITATFLTLLVVPAVYQYIDKFRKWIHLRVVSKVLTTEVKDV